MILDDGRLFSRLWSPRVAFDSPEGGAGAGGGGDAGASSAGGEDEGGPSAGGGEEQGQEQIESPWSIDSVPEEFRDEARRLDNHWKSQYQRKLGELQPRIVNEDLAGLLSRLEGEDTADGLG